MELSYKQYLIANHSLPENGMMKIPLWGDVCLFAGVGLPVKQGITKGGQTYCLLGEAYCTNIYPRDVQEDLHDDIDGDIFSITKHWVGRWVLILGGEMITDACGLMSAFYFEDNSRWMVSSSLALISSILGLSMEKKVATSGLTWSLLPSTLQRPVRLLFCTQKITLGQGLTLHFYNRFSIWRYLTHEERVNTITNSLVIGLKNIQSISHKLVWIALTAGKDSRLTFAAALTANLQFETFTAMHHNISDADRSLPEEISRRYSIKHNILRKRRFSKSGFEEFCLFSGYNSLGADAELYASSQFSQIPSDSIIIRSGLFEAGQVYGRSITGGNELSFISGMKSYYRSSFKDSTQEAAFYDWIKYQQEHPMPGIDIRDRFYLEQRLNGWASAIEQSLTINPFVSIQIANSAVVLGCLLYASTEERKDLQLSHDLIRALNVKLLDFPINRQTYSDRVRIVINGLKRRLHLC